jgi:hypothetical protein
MSWFGSLAKTVVTDSLPVANATEVSLGIVRCVQVRSVGVGAQEDETNCHDDDGGVNEVICELYLRGLAPAIVHLHTMPPLPVELWIKILEFTLHPLQPADIPLHFPFISSARARRREEVLVSQDKAMLRVLSFVCRSWRKMCLSFRSRRVHIRFGRMGSRSHSTVHASNCTSPSVTTILLEISFSNNGIDLVQYGQLVEGTIAKAPGVRFLQISMAAPYDRDTGAQQRVLQVIQRALSPLSNLSGLDLLSHRSLDIENVFSAVARIPQLQVFRCNLVVRKLPTINSPLLPHLEVLSVCMDIHVPGEMTPVLAAWLRGWRMPCLTQLVSTESWVQDDWLWILGLLEHNGSNLRALHLLVSLCVIHLTARILMVRLEPSSSWCIFTSSLGGLPQA